MYLFLKFVIEMPMQIILKELSLFSEKSDPRKNINFFDFSVFFATLLEFWEILVGAMSLTLKFP